SIFFRPTLKYPAGPRRIKGKFFARRPPGGKIPAIPLWASCRGEVCVETGRLPLHRRGERAEEPRARQPLHRWGEDRDDKGSPRQRQRRWSEMDGDTNLRQIGRASCR